MDLKVCPSVCVFVHLFVCVVYLFVCCSSFCMFSIGWLVYSASGLLVV